MTSINAAGIRPPSNMLAHRLRTWVARVALCCGVALAALPVHAGPGMNEAGDQVVNINRANAQVLAQVLDGVGLSRAQAIVEYRDQHGNFRDVYELANIKGIGERTVEVNEDKILLQD
jgi:competence protein ComEA